MTKKPYLVSIHTHGGSMWEASGTHHLVELTKEELDDLDRTYQYEEIASEMYVCITPITKILDNAGILEVIKKAIDTRDPGNLELSDED